MKLIGRSALLICLLIGLIFGIASGVGAATATVTLLPGKLAITDTPALLLYTGATATDEARTYTTTFSVSITDATGSRAGWHIQAALGPFLSATGTSAFASTATITGASVITQTGRAPSSTLAYPRPFHADSDTIFSAAAGSGIGKSLVTFATELSIPADSADSDQYRAALAVTILSGP